MPPRDYPDPEAFSELLQSLVKDSYELLSCALDLPGLGLSHVLDAEYFSRSIGMFEQNNVGIRLRNPACELVESIVNNGGANDEEILSVLQTVQEIAENIDGTIAIIYLYTILDQLKLPTKCILDAACCDEGDEDEEEDDSGDLDAADGVVGKDDESSEEDNEYTAGEEDLEELNTVGGVRSRVFRLLEEEDREKLFPPLDGTAFYSMICKINHSCDPNVFVKYVCHPSVGLAAELHAVRDILEGEELTQSYIDQTNGKLAI